MKTGRAYLLHAGTGVDRTIGGSAFARVGDLIAVFDALLVGREFYSLQKSIARHETRLDMIEAAFLDAVETDPSLSPDDSLARLRINRTAIFTLCFGTLIRGAATLLSELPCHFYTTRERTPC